MKEKEKEPTGNRWDNAVKQHVNQLYQLMQSEDLEELEIKEDDFYLHLKRKGKQAVATAGAAPVTIAAPAPVAAEPVPPAAPAGLTVKTPIIGVFYRAASPTSAPFVKEGDIVDPSKTLCIVEAMKVMNEIKAEYRMKILKILVENGKPITSAQDLFVVEKA